MSVRAILNLMGTLSIGLDNPGPTDTDVFMRFINLTYIEILQQTLSQNPFVTITTDFLDCNVGVCAPTSKTIFIPKSVYNISQNLPLTGTTYDEIVRRDPTFSNTNGTTLSWYMSGGNICVYPNITSLVADGGGIGIHYIAQPTLLNQLSTTAQIMIPAMYQTVLADGACYYLFQSETGFKDQLKMATAMNKYEEGKRKLFAYLVRTGGKKIFSSYSAV